MQLGSFFGLFSHSKAQKSIGASYFRCFRATRRLHTAALRNIGRMIILCPLQICDVTQEMTLKKAITLVCMMAATLPASAEEFVKAGQPCLSDVCVGDDMSSFAKIKWDVAGATFGGKPASARKPDDKQLKELTDKFAPTSATAARDAANYLVFGAFDSEGLPKIAKVGGFCEPMDLAGTFKSPEGHLTRVRISSEPGNGPSVQGWRVKSIIRRFPKDMTAAQTQELAAQLKQRYASVKQTSSQSDLKVPTWKFDESRHELTLSAPFGSVSKKKEQLRQYPGCAKTAAGA